MGVVLAALLVAIVVHDAATIRKIHAATVWGIAFAIGVDVAYTAIAATGTGLALVRWLQ